MINSNVPNTEKDSAQYFTCSECMYEQTCPRFSTCEFLLSTTDDNDNVDYFHKWRKNRSHYSGTNGTLSSGRKNYITSKDGKTALYSYHKGIVNDALKIIRAGGTAYVYTEQALKDVLYFEPTASVYIKDKIIYLKLPKVMSSDLIC